MYPSVNCSPHCSHQGDGCHNQTYLSHCWNPNICSHQQPCLYLRAQSNTNCEFSVGTSDSLAAQHSALPGPALLLHTTLYVFFNISVFKILSLVLPYYYTLPTMYSAMWEFSTPHNPSLAISLQPSMAQNTHHCSHGNCQKAYTSQVFECKTWPQSAWIMTNAQLRSLIHPGYLYPR